MPYTASVVDATSTGSLGRAMPNPLICECAQNGSPTGPEEFFGSRLIYPPNQLTPTRPDSPDHPAPTID
jgi:hypothetical protein